MLKPWNGKNPNPNGYHYPEQWKLEPDRNYQIDEHGTVWYTDGNGKLSIWCPAIDLGRHLHHLNQIAARR